MALGRIPSGSGSRNQGRVTMGLRGPKPGEELTPKRKPGRPPGTGNGYNERVQFHGKKGIRARIKAKAKKLGLSPSELLRQLLEEK